MLNLLSGMTEDIYYTHIFWAMSCGCPVSVWLGKSSLGSLEAQG
jgi:hypothetical protein